MELSKNIKYLSATITEYVMGPEIDCVCVNTTLNPITIFLPNIIGSGLDYSLKKFNIIDDTNNASINTITVRPIGNNTINKQSAVYINTNGGTIELQPCDNINYMISGNNLSGGQVNKRTTTIILFDADSNYGNIDAPLTGNLTTSLVGANLDVTALIIHNDSGEPEYPPTFKKSTMSGDYVTGENNLIMVIYLSATVQVYSISQYDS